MSKKRAVKAPSNAATAETTESSKAMQSTDNAFQASLLGQKDDQEVAEEKAADSLAWKVVSHMRAEGTDMRQADPRSEYIPAGLAAAFEAVAGVDVKETPLWTSGADRKAEEMGANAFAVDEEVWMPMSQWKPTDPNFEFLFAHEVAHVALNHVPVGGPTRQDHAAVENIGFLKRGSQGGNVRDLQNALVNLGFMTAAEMRTGPGIFGRRTHAAVVAFQSRHGLYVDGVVGQQTRNKMVELLVQAHNTGEERHEGGATREANTFTGRPAVRFNDEGIMVKEMQRLLNSHGASLGIDGEYGPQTRTALRGFQRANGLTVDGIAGPATAAKLNDANAAKIPAAGASQGNAVGPVNTSVEVDVDDADPGNRLGDSRMNPQARRLAVETIKTLQQQGLSPYVVDGYRSFAKQNQVYEQGRSTPGNIVTYVRGGGSWHNYGLAVDIAFWDNSHRRPSWDAPMAHWRALGNAGKAAGFTRWMGDEGWDFPHLEYHPNWGNRASNLVSTYNNGGLQAVWDRVT